MSFVFLTTRSFREVENYIKAVTSANSYQELNSVLDDLISKTSVKAEEAVEALTAVNNDLIRTNNVLSTARTNLSNSVNLQRIDDITNAILKNINTVQSIENELLLKEKKIVQIGTERNKRLQQFLVMKQDTDKQINMQQTITSLREILEKLPTGEVFPYSEEEL